MTNQQINSLVARAGIAHPQFIYYLILNWRDRLLQDASGSRTPIVNKSVLSRYEFDVPSLNSQQAIAEVLGALDDKIASNIGLTERGEDLLAAHFDALGLDSISPAGADLAALTDLVELNPRTPAPDEAEPVYIDMQKLPTRGMLIPTWDRRPKRGGARFRNGDTLLARITPCLENRKTGFVDLLAGDAVGIGSTEYIVMRSRPGVPPVLSYFLAVSDRFRTFAIRHMVGTSGRQRVAAADLGDYEIARPKEMELVRFGEYADSVVRLNSSLRNENSHLAALRDTLLPHLMSGRLRVKDAEKQVEAVV